MVILIGEAALAICEKSINRRIPDQAVEMLFSKPVIAFVYSFKNHCRHRWAWAILYPNGTEYACALKLMDADQWKFVLSPDSSGDSVFYSMFV